MIEILLLNRRDGTWTRPDPAPVRNDVMLVVAGIVIYAIFLFAHQWLFGVSPIA